MTIKCKYCDCELSYNDKLCPGCGAPNDSFISADIIPHTIEELELYCLRHNIPTEKMRFFIGSNNAGPKCFGIFRQHNGDVVVYKNKANGSRTIRYLGPDEAYAVNEIYERINSEINLRKEKLEMGESNESAYDRSNTDSKTSRFLNYFSGIAGKIIVYVLILCSVSAVLNRCSNTPKNGYYSYDNSNYYLQNDTWYLFDNVGTNWIIADTVSDELVNHFSNFYIGSSPNYADNMVDFSESDYFVDDSGSIDLLNDVDWLDFIFDIWNTDDTDWDSDW